jgi:hypothetical protein
MLASLSPEARKITQLAMQSGGGKNIATGKDVDNYSAYHGRFGPTWNSVKSSQRAGDPRVGFELGGTEGLSAALPKFLRDGIRFLSGKSKKTEWNPTAEQTRLLAEQQLAVLKEIAAKSGGSSDPRSNPYYSQPLGPIR